MLRLVRFIVGVLLGLLLWVATASAYNRFVAAGTETLLQFDTRFADAEVTAGKSRMTVLSPSGSFPTTILPVAQLTYNVILLVGLFGSNDRPWRRANLLAFFVSLILIAALHPIGAFVTAESTYANQLDRWSEEHFSTAAAASWRIAEMFYRLVGLFGAVFACWWLASHSTATEERRNNGAQHHGRMASGSPRRAVRRMPH
ncbi:MAG: hypothetical protein WA208_18905 [Thermoanaerobaculia bacterium]